MGKINQKAGVIGEYEVKDLLECKGYNVTMAKNRNQRGYDLFTEKGSKRWLVQVKTDANGDGKYKNLTKRQEFDLIEMAEDKNRTPILIQYDLWNEIIHACLYVKSNKPCQI